SGLGVYQDELRSQLVLGSGGSTTSSTSTATTTTTLSSSTTSSSTTSTVPATTTTVPVSGVCGNGQTPPSTYAHVVVFAMENRTWSNVGLGFNATNMPYLHSLAQQCTWYPTSEEAAPNPENSATQYVSQLTGFVADISPDTVTQDCAP